MTRISKDIRNGWQAETRFDLPEISDRHFLQIHTMKRYDGLLATNVSVNERTADGLGYTHKFPGDYLRRWAGEKVRVTEKAVATQHAGVLEQIEQIKAGALIAYGVEVTGWEVTV